MRDQVAMSKNNGQLVIAIPLFRQFEQENLESLDGYRISITEEKPLAYVIDCGPDSGMALQMFNAEFAEKHLEFLGDL